ncbi:MAG: hypothetical protein Q4B06_00990 [Candidatus Saccharibacteria bacterium]|nr:hypothetical protein [Candidatus Saccharibacteria bacterium]
MPQTHTLIRNNIESFWLDKTKQITNENSLRLFVCEYIDLLGADYDASIAKALLQLQHVSNPSLQPLADELINLAISIRSEHDIATRLQLWQKVAMLARYKKKVTGLEVNLTTRKEVIAYITLLLSDTYSQLWPPHDIAYKIVNVMAHYDIQKDDSLLYTIWDLATEIETMTTLEMNTTNKWSSLVRLGKKLA